MVARPLHKRYRGQLHNGGVAWEYLIGRGLTSSTIRDFHLGYVDRPLADGHERYAGRIVIPYLSALGHESTLRFHSFTGINITGRRDPKYLQPFGIPLTVFNVRATDGAHLYICEGEYDTMILSQMDYNAVGLPGSTSWRKAWRFLFRDCDSVTVVTDPDEAGRNLALEVCRDIAMLGIPVRDVELPGRKDVNEWFLEGESKLQQLLQP